MKHILAYSVYCFRFPTDACFIDVAIDQRMECNWSSASIFGCVIFAYATLLQGTEELPVVVAIQNPKIHTMRVNSIEAAQTALRDLETELENQCPNS